MNLGQVRDLKDNYTLEKLYRVTWAKRYGMEPEIEEYDNNALRALQGRLGTEKTKRLIEVYVNMNDKWFLENAHSLTVLQKNLLKVLAVMGVSDRSHNTSKGIEIKTTIGCDGCYRPFTYIGAPDFSKRMVCQNCAF